MITEEMIGRLCEKAVEMREYAYAPYSRFQVGAALLGKSGRIYTGCNIESASHTPAVCAERTAVFKGVSEGEREFEAIAIAGGPEGQSLDFCAPCGVCRQVLREFCQPEFPIILAKSRQEYQVHTLGELLPFSFGPESLGGTPPSR
ncbi:MAG: cytidine deaminase [Eubacteriales bacterium]|nr:cytidine deaminase [Eubacteriales bacterium]